MLTMYKRKRSTPGATTSQVRAHLLSKPSKTVAPKVLSDDEILKRDKRYHKLVNELLDLEPCLRVSMDQDNSFSDFLSSDGDLYLLILELSYSLSSAIRESRNTNEIHYRHAIEMMNETHGYSLLQILKDNPKIFQFFDNNLIHLTEINSRYQQYASEHQGTVKKGHPRLPW